MRRSKLFVKLVILWGLLFYLCSCNHIQKLDNDFEKSLIVQLGKEQPSREYIALENDKLKIKINIYGAELSSLYHKKTKTELLWQGTPPYWSRQATIMFPVAIKLKDFRYTYKNKQYLIPSHGIAPYRNFKVLPQKNKNTVSLELSSDALTLNSYPFDFRFIVTYTLEDLELLHTFKVVNRDNKTMFYTIGGHPAFNTPLTNKLTRRDYQFWFAKPITSDRLLVTKNLRQNQSLPFLQDENTLNFADTRIPYAGMLVKNIPVEEIGIGLAGKVPFIKVNRGNFPNVNLWSKPDTPLAAIEPMDSYHDYIDSPPDIDKKTHMNRLKAGKTAEYFYTIIVDDLDSNPYQ